jgi:hypothetical protein
MSEVNLISMGALVSFIVVGGFYIYVREQFAHQDRKSAKTGADKTVPVVAAVGRDAA